MRMVEDLVIFTNLDLLNETYIPPDIPAREQQIKELIDCLAPALKKKKPVHVWLHSKPGTGKTLIAKFNLRKIDREG